MELAETTKTAARMGTEDYKKKYFDSLESLEREQERFKTIDAVLKRLIGRLCVVARGQSAKLDDEIQKLQAAIRRDAKGDELDKIAAALTDAIHALDQPAEPVPAQEMRSAKAQTAESSSSQESMPGDEGIRAVLAALIAELRRDPELVIQVDVLDAQLANSLTRDRLPDILSSLSELLGRRIGRIERAKQEVEVLLSHMVDKLDEIGQFVVTQAQHQTQSLASRASLSTQLAGEMKAMGDSVESGAELSQIRAQVRSRLESIGRYLQEFRQREDAQASDMQARNEKMRARVAELEAEASRLHNQLKDEQRQSTLDALTKIPNRLAYEKHMEEELKRFQRFKQPTCVAVWDVDLFKKINDTYGHAAGDRVLNAVAQCLAGRIRGTDFLARYGGEEFVMILRGAKLDDAIRLADELRIGVATLKLHSRGIPLQVTISSGLTALAAGDSVTSAFERADEAMYQAKARGRNCCVSI